MEDTMKRHFIQGQIRKICAWITGNCDSEEERNCWGYERSLFSRLTTVNSCIQLSYTSSLKIGQPVTKLGFDILKDTFHTSILLCFTLTRLKLTMAKLLSVVLTLKKYLTKPSFLYANANSVCRGIVLPGYLCDVISLYMKFCYSLSQIQWSHNTHNVVVCFFL